MATVVLIAVALIAVECLIFRPSVIFQCEYVLTTIMHGEFFTISAGNPLCTGLYLAFPKQKIRSQPELSTW